jgi:CheY-like chemotaxis protein
MNSAHLESPLEGTILVVDDEPSVLAIAAAILNTIGVTPRKARNGEEAVVAMQSEVAAGRKVALVVQDLTMPGGMSGFETMEALRDIDPDIRVIACSGFFQDAALELCRSIGFTNILAKPYTPDSLLGIIRRTLHESPPPRVPKPVTPVEPEPEGTSFFAPAAPVFSSASAALPATFQDDDDEDEEDEAPLATAAVTPDSLTASTEAKEAPETRRPSFLASALALSIRSRLKKSQENSVEQVEAVSLPE